MWVIGSGPMEEPLRREFSGEQVQFFGRIEEVEKLDLLARSHAVVVTSVREGWGLVVTEAAAVGRPAIGYDVPGLRDSLRASNGVLVQPPTIEMMARTIASVVPKWASDGVPVVQPGGVTSWSEVAAAVLDHLERVRHGRRR